jgi:hypothetical protein
MCHAMLSNMPFSTAAATLIQLQVQCRTGKHQNPNMFGERGLQNLLLKP